MGFRRGADAHVADQWPEFQPGLGDQVGECLIRGHGHVVADLV